ncbi:MAG TPA: hypothetical protein VIH58_12780 [Chthoniobacterales bacterium]|jgi:hypothetical protein
MNPLEKLTVKIVADGADMDGMISLHKSPSDSGNYHKSNPDAESWH